MTIYIWEWQLKRAKGSSHSQNSQCCLTVVWWNASFRNLLSHHSLSNLGGLQTVVPVHSTLHPIFICSICYSHVETLPGQHFWKAQLILCHAGPVVTARQRSAVTLAVPNSEHDRSTSLQSFLFSWSCPRVPLFQCLNLCKLRWKSMEFYA